MKHAGWWCRAAAGALVLLVAGCDFLLDDTGGGSQASLDRRESFSTPASYITIPEEVSRQPGVAAAELRGKWLAAIGTSFEVLQSSSGFTDYYRSDSRGDAELFTFYDDSSYRLDYVFNISTGSCHSSAAAAEIGAFAAASDDLSLDLAPTAQQVSHCACSADNCSADPFDNPPRGYQLFSAVIKEFAVDGSDNGVRNDAIILAGPCAPWMIGYGDHDCPAGGEVIFQRVE